MIGKDATNFHWTWGASSTKQRMQLDDMDTEDTREGRMEQKIEWIRRREVGVLDCEREEEVWLEEGTNYVSD